MVVYVYVGCIIAISKRRLRHECSISLFASFLEKENSLETLIVIFENVSPKGFFWQNMKNFEISVLTTNSRYLQTAALNIPDSITYYPVI